MNKTTRICYSLLMNIPMSIVMTVSATLLSVWQGKAVFFLPVFLLGLLVAYFTGVAVTLFIPVPLWGERLRARYKGGDTGGKLLMNLFISFVNTIAISLVMTLFNVCIIGRQGFIPFLIAFLTMLVPLTAVAMLTAMICDRPVGRLAARLGGQDIDKTE